MQFKKSKQLVAQSPSQISQCSFLKQKSSVCWSLAMMTGCTVRHVNISVMYFFEAALILIQNSLSMSVLYSKIMWKCLRNGRLSHWTLQLCKQEHAFLPTLFLPMWQEPKDLLVTGSRKLFLQYFQWHQISY